MTAREDSTANSRPEIRFVLGACSLGQLLVATRARGICAIFLGDDEHSLRLELQRTFSGVRLILDQERCAEVLQRACALIERPGTPFQQPLDIQGTPFQQRVWAALRQIPMGETLSYGEIAERIGAPRAARAVAHACAANLWAVAVPCHRVVRADGSLSGYRWGIERQRALLAREKAIATLGAATTSTT